MKKLFVLRHFHCSAATPEMADSERKLSSLGQQAMFLIAPHIAGVLAASDAIFSSPAKRAKQSIGGLIKLSNRCHGAGNTSQRDKLRLLDNLYHCDSDNLILWLKELPANWQCIMLVGHNPQLQDMLASLLGEPGFKLSAGNLVEVNINTELWSELSPRTAALEQRLQAEWLDYDFYKQLCLDKGRQLPNEPARQFTAYQKRIAGLAGPALIDSDDEFLHQLRVNCRRTQSLMTLCNLTEQQSARPLLRWLKRLLKRSNTIRDIDVMLHAFKRWPQAMGDDFIDLTRLSRYLHLLRQQSMEKFRNNVASIAKKQAKAEKAAIELDTQNPLADNAGEPPQSVTQIMQSSLKQLTSRCQALSPHSSDRDFHQCRLALKKVRYQHQICPSDDLTHLNWLERCQDLLGELNDYSVQQVLITAFDQSSQDPTDKALSKRLLQWLEAQKQEHKALILQTLQNR